MQNIYSGLVVCLLLSLTAHSQQAISVKQRYSPRPAVFSRFPNRFEIDPQQLKKAFTASVNDTVTIQLSKQHAFTGVVIDKVQQSPTLLTLNIKSEQLSGAMMHISYNTAPDAVQTFRARIVHPQKGDVMMLSREDKKYFLLKEEQQFFLAE